MSTDLQRVDDAIAAGRAALADANWGRARDRFETALEAGESAEALEGLSWAAWWLGGEELTLTARERAYRAYRAADESCGAARMAVWLASDVLDFRGDDAVAAGWLERARRLLDARDPCPEHGWLWLMEADLALRVGSDPRESCASRATRPSWAASSESPISRRSAWPSVASPLP
jgi:hypothetical protein